jgi:hypothetical protein
MGANAIKGTMGYKFKILSKIAFDTWHSSVGQFF